MRKSLVVSEQDSIAAILENDRAVEFFVNRGELLLGDIYTATVENILPGIDAAFVNLGKDKMGFLHANDVPGQAPLKERLVPKQKLLVQITKEPTGHKGPRVSTAMSLPGRFLVLVPEERGVSISRRISEARERARLKSVVNLMKPPGVGLIIRTEAKGQGESELFDDFEHLWDRWQTIVSEAEASIGPKLIYRDQDLLYRIIRDAYSHDVTDIIVDNADAQKRAQEYLQGWASRNTKISHHQGPESLLISKGIDREIECALSDRVELPSGGHLNIQPTEALTVIDVNSGRFTSSRTQAETVRRTNIEAAQEIPRQLRLRNVGGMVIVDFIDMDSRKDQQQVLEVFQRSLEEDRAKPQVGQLSDLGLVELTRRRQGQSLRELFTSHCVQCHGLGVIPTLELGTPDNRRIITFRSKEEEAKGRLSGRRMPKAQGQVMRAASAANGRIVPTMEDEEDVLSFVPEEVLEQMPDDLLDRPAKTLNKAKGERYNNNDDDEDDNEESFDSNSEEGDSEEPFDAKQEAVSMKSAFFESEDEPDQDSQMNQDLQTSISEVAEVYREIETKGRAPAVEAEVSQRYSPEHHRHSEENHESVNNESFHGSHHGAHGHSGDDSGSGNDSESGHDSNDDSSQDSSQGSSGHSAGNSEHSSELSDDSNGSSEEIAGSNEDSESSEESSSNEHSEENEEREPEKEIFNPFETEMDPVTGIYRLKPKPAKQDQEHNGGNGEGHSGESEGNSEGTESGEHSHHHGEQSADAEQENSEYKQLSIYQGHHEHNEE